MNPKWNTNELKRKAIDAVTELYDELIRQYAHMLEQKKNNPAEYSLLCEMIGRDWGDAVRAEFDAAIAARHKLWEI